jgi:hypothetical protein
LQKNVLHPIPQFVIQGVWKTGRRCPPKFTERKGLAIDQRLQGEAQQRNVERNRGLACVAERVAIRDRLRLRPIVHRQKRRLRERAGKRGIGFGGLRARIDDEKNQRRDGVTACLFEKADLLRDGIEILEGAVADVENLCAVGGGDQPVEERHLAASVADIGDRRERRQIVGQLRSFVG